jgi:hypothetical protein
VPVSLPAAKQISALARLVVALAVVNVVMFEWLS